MEDSTVYSQNYLADKLRLAKGETVLYCDYYYFVLFIGEFAEFWLHAHHLLGKVKKEDLPAEVLEFLEANCPKFVNFYKDGKYDKNSTIEWRHDELYAQGRPVIGNLYSGRIYKIVTEKDPTNTKRIIHLHQDWAENGWAEFEKIGEKEVAAFLTLNIFSDTHLTIKSIYQLDCFKNTSLHNEYVFEGIDLREEFPPEDVEIAREIGESIRKSKQTFENSKQRIKNTIIGAIIGDVIEPAFEGNNIKTTDFDLFNTESDFTGDTVLTIAVAHGLLGNRNFREKIYRYGNNYLKRSYGINFWEWLHTKQPCGYFGNRAAMRVSAVGFACIDIDTILRVAKQTVGVTHSHPESIRGAQAIATAILLARRGWRKNGIKAIISVTFGYDLDFTLDETAPLFNFGNPSERAVPYAIMAFLKSSDFESAIRLAISIGDVNNKLACMTGGIAAAYYKEIPTEIKDFVLDKLPPEFIKVLNMFDEVYG